MATSWDNLSDPIFHYAAGRPNARALIDGPTVLTYAELADLVGRASVYLASRGIGKGARVGVSLSNSIDHAILMMALLRLGATLAELHYNSLKPLDPALVARFGITKLFLEPGAVAPAGVETVHMDIGWRAALARHAGDHRAEATADELAILTSTSGSTGAPKSVLQSQRMILERHATVLDRVADEGSEDDPPVMILTASLSLSPFFRRLIGQLAAGGPVALLPEFAHTIDFIRAIAVWPKSVLAATANMCRAFIAAAPVEGVLFPGVRSLVSLGTPLYADEKRAIVRRVTPNFYDFYGASGMGPMACLLPSEIETMAASVGRAAPGIEIEIVDAHGGPCPPGTVGRVRARGATSAKSFVSAAEAPDTERFADGWYYPGEFGYLDENGYLFLKGRIPDVIRRSGVDLFPTEIEEALASHPGVKEVAAVGLPSDSHGAEVVVVVVKNGEPAHADLAQHCRARLTPEKWPDRIYYAAALPQTVGGKPDRGQVRAMVMDEIARRQKPGAR
jgi:acyl-coenzyme A synthetase/AMP-(fatty) acid ligase